MNTYSPKFLLSAALAAFAVTAASAQTIVSGANALTWYDINTNSGHGSSLSGGTLNFTSSTAADGTNIAFANFTAKTLAVGESITLSFSLTVNSVATQDNNFRFGLFYSGGTLRTVDATGNNPPETRNDLGFKYRLATHPSSSSGRVSRYYFTNGGETSTALTSNNGTQTQLGGDVGPGVVLSNTTRSLALTVARVNATDVTVGAFIDGNLLDGGRTMANSPTFTFDQIAFSMVNTNEVGYSISNLQVVTAIPEPSTYAALAGLGVLGLVIGMRLRKRRV
jgi:hypothetical protein